MKEAEVTKVFLGRLALERWFRFVSPPIPRGKKGSMARKLSEESRRLYLSQVAEWARGLDGPGCILTRRNSGVFYNPAGVPVQLSVAGQWDFAGILYPSGRAISVEMKSSTGALSKEQLLMGEIEMEFGVAQLIVRDPEVGAKALREITFGEWGSAGSQPTSSEP